MINGKMVETLREELARLRAEKAELVKECDKLDLECTQYAEKVVSPMENGIGDFTDAQCDEIYEHWDALVKKLDDVYEQINAIDIFIADLKSFSRWYTEDLADE